MHIETTAVQGRRRSRGGPEQVWGYRFSKVGALAFLQDVGMIWVSEEGDLNWVLKDVCVRRKGKAFLEINNTMNEWGDDLCSEY